MTKSDNRESNKTLGLDETQVIEETGQLDIGRRLLGRYEIKQIKGRGRYGAVYLAQDLQLNTNIAIKVIDATWLNNEQQLLNFKNELLLLRQLNHPNILRVYEYYQDGPLHFITMDWVDGQSLTEVIKGSNLELEQILALVEQLLSGLNYAQETGVSHRDIKPDNILLDDTGRLVIIDFGMSILEHEALSGAFSGTPLYAAPEYLQSGKVNATTDLYSAGCVIYQLFYGCLPFNEPNTEALIRAKLAGAKERSARFNGLARFSHWCLSLIAADATQRPQTVAQAKHAFIQLRQQASKPPFRTARAAWSLVSLFVVSISIWLFLPTEPTPNVNESVLSVAILSTKDAEPEIDEAFIDYISYRLSEQSQLRVVAPQRVSQLLHQLGYQPPLTDPQVEILLDLLQLDVLLEPTLIQTGTNSQDVLYTAISAEGFEIKRQRLTRAPFFERDWQSTFTPLLDYVENAWDLNPANNLSLTVNDAQLQQILPVKAHIRKGDLVSAQQQMTQLLESSPGSALFWLYQGEVYLHTGQYPEAEQAYGQALALGQSQSFATVFAGARLNDLAGKSNLAEAGYLQLAAAFPNSTEIKLLLAEFYEITEQTQKVEKVLLELVDIDPNHPRAWFNLGKLAYMTGDFDEALDQYFTHALVVAKKLKNQAQQGDVLNAFGVVYEQLGETDLAFDYYGQALSLRRASGNLAGVATTMNNLASVHLSVGQYDEARRY